MNKEHAKGELNKVKGNVKEGIGRTVDDRSMEGEGKLDRAKGSIQKGIGNIKDKVERGIDKAAEKLDIDRDKKRGVA